MQTLKETIKGLAAEQPQLKNQRKTIYLIGERTMTARQAWFKHQENRELLRAMYFTYATLLERPFEDVEVNTKLVDKFVEQYKDNIK